MLKKMLKRLARPMLEEITSALESHLEDEGVAQKTLMQQYRFLASEGNKCFLSMKDVGFRKYSQFEEDGIWLYIFS